MRRVHTTFDLLEAHIIVGMLQHNGVDARVFDADFVRQDWFRSIAYGGYRIVVPNDATDPAKEALQKYKNGNLALTGEHRLLCPACGESGGNDNPWPRRYIFLAIYLLGCVVTIGFLMLMPSVAAFLVVIGATLIVGIVLPCVAVLYFKWRFRCEACGHRWYSPPLRGAWAELSQAASAEQP